MDPNGELTSESRAKVGNYPLPISGTVRILGVSINPRFTLDAHFKNIATKAAVRPRVLAKATNYHWGLRAGVLHTTRNAVINSLLRYTLVITGSVFPPNLVRCVNARIINVAAAQVGG